MSKVERYRKEANKYGELAKYAQPAYLGDFYRKIAVRYAFMAQDLLRQPERKTKVVVGGPQSSSQPSLIEQEIHDPVTPIRRALPR